jgi:hypothetical protein
LDEQPSGSSEGVGAGAGFASDDAAVDDVVVVVVEVAHTSMRLHSAFWKNLSQQPLAVSKSVLAEMPGFLQDSGYLSSLVHVFFAPVVEICHGLSQTSLGDDGLSGGGVGQSSIISHA